MKPEAVFSAAVELLDDILTQSQPANEIINTYTRNRRYIGSKDRRALTDMVWQYIRHRARLDFLYPEKTTAEKLSLMQTLQDKKFPFHIANEVPEWLVPLISDSEHELPALLDSADTILRANGNREKIQKQLLSEGVETELTTLSPYGLRLKKRANLQGTSAYRSGLIEIQDEGSQCVALETGIKANDTVLDYCAGAGGKSLIFAQMMQNKGKIVAHDISDKSLIELQKRAERAKATCIQVQKPLQPALYDHVVVDAPCSGTGTWRRCPDMRLKLTQEQFQNLLKTQADILEQAKKFVKEKGFLSYMTCSLTASENTGQIQNFLSKNSNFKHIKSRQFSPYQTQTDGLFICILQRQ